jgi:dihydroorotate dehydrogenase
MDKDGVALLFWQALGFSFVEAGTVTPGEGQIGNNKPRMARLPSQEGLINRMGFNNHGVKALCKNVLDHREAGQLTVPLGINIGASKASMDWGPMKAIEDYQVCALAASEVADYITINVSSPNTKGLRSLQHTGRLREIIETVRAATKEKTRPILIKVSPDLSAVELEQITELAVEMGVQGIIATNTTIKHSVVHGAHLPIEGGISGKPVRDQALYAVETVYRKLVDLDAHQNVFLVGAGGISTGSDAFDFIQAGATLLQLYTAMVYQGPGVVKEIINDLTHCLQENGFSHISEAIGVKVTGEQYA